MHKTLKSVFQRMLVAKLACFYGLQYFVERSFFGLAELFYFN